MLVIVTGLPRSGTSLMMNMLKAGGMHLHTDDIRVSDEHNPDGYFENSLVNKLYKDNTFLESLGHGAIKIMAYQLYAIPFTVNAHVIFMHRHLQDVRASQNKMIRASVTDYPATFANTLKTMQELKDAARTYLTKNPFLDTIDVQYEILMSNPLHTATKIAEFLLSSVNASEMVKVVKPQLWRNRYSVS